MPVTYEIDAEHEIIRTSLAGELTAAHISAHFDELLADPSRPAEAWVLLDARGMTAIVTVDLIRVASVQIGRARGRIKFRAVAVVTVGLAQYGMFRMSQVMLESHFGPTQVFRDHEEAERWLLSLSAGHA
jgi:hypothetical protein